MIRCSFAWTTTPVPQSVGEHWSMLRSASTEIQLKFWLILVM